MRGPSIGSLNLIELNKSCWSSGSASGSGVELLGVVVVVAVIVLVVVELRARARRVGVHFVFVDIYRFVAHVSQGEGPSILNLNPLLGLSSL
jgi:hypothetical protein